MYQQMYEKNKNSGIKYLQWSPFISSLGHCRLLAGSDLTSVAMDIANYKSRTYPTKTSVRLIRVPAGWRGGGEVL